ncbi:hypothetical protein Poli38472_013646 [Pythium oligandrum]|uniref:FYVE-type domain-containing protein n=1 Tax=Pythium oligandrum TaxID=41045 RepID=A0A8K1FJX9_PYTOL|nr:hypothetical protein Poli38472_013646 [Pythium oligandrum]|eukprot:TMW61183.1 hypothetical protein Poli38472_013646 [Pythium oligandrum]
MSTQANSDRSKESEGLMVHDHALGRKALVMPSQDISDDVLATLPKLQVTVDQALTKLGRKWKEKRRKNKVNLYELVPGGGEDADVAHAFLATAELHCHVNEVLSVLVHRDSDDMDVTVQSVAGSKVRGGGIYYQQLQPLESGLVSEPNKQPHTALFGVLAIVIRPKFSMKRQANLRIGFSTCTIRFRSRTRAYHLMKTLPKNVHNKVVPGNEGAVLEGRLDHLGIGWDIRLTKNGGYGSNKHTTQVVVHSYTATVPPSEYGRLHPASFNASALAAHRKSYSNSDAERAIEVLTKSLREFETVIRRRRLGFQSFVSQPLEQDADTPICLICRKNFSFFRHDHFCRLCGHVVCGECSGMYEVEAIAGKVHKTRCCLACIRRVDSCQFDDEDLVPALGPLIVDSSDDDWEVSVASLSDHLMLNETQETTKALESLDMLVRIDSFRSTVVSEGSSRDSVSSTTNSPITVKKLTKKAIVLNMEKRLAEHLKTVKNSYHAEECPVYDSERDYAFEYADTTSHPDVPLAPHFDTEKEARRLHYMEISGVLNEDYDRSALDLITWVAAMRFNVPISYVGMVDDKFFHAIGNYGLELSQRLTHDENLCIHTLYAERPVVLRNPQRDMRFAQMPGMRIDGIGFYAGFPVRAPDGTVVATLCLIDVVPHNNITTKDYAEMEMLSKWVEKLLGPQMPPKDP